MKKYPDYVRFTIRIVKTLNGLLEKETKERGIGKNSLITQILWDYCENKIGGKQNEKNNHDGK